MRYRAARSAVMDSTSTTTGRDLVPTKVAASLWDRLMKYKANLLNFPQVETCDLIIVDRSIDPVCTNHILVLWNVLSFQASRPKKLRNLVFFQFEGRCMTQKIVDRKDPGTRGLTLKQFGRNH